MNNIPKNYSPGTSGYEDDSPEFRRYLSLFLSNWYWFAIALFLALMLAYGINTYSEKVYTVTASLLIKEDRGTDITSGLDRLVPGGDMFRSMQNLQNEMGILKSFSVNYRAMLELPEFNVTIIGIGRRGIAQNRHYKSAPFIVLYDSLREQRANQKIYLKITSDDTYTLDINGTELSRREWRFGERFNEAGYDFTIVKRDPENFRYDESLSNRYIFWFNRPEQLANSYRSKLSINPVNEEATLVTLSVSGYVPQQEADYLNKLMEVYNKLGLEFKNETAENAIRFIDSQLQLIADSLANAEKKLEEFRQANKLIDLSAEGNTIKTKLESFSREKITTQLQKQYYEYLLEYMSGRKGTADVVSPSIMGVTDPVLTGLVEEFSKLQNQKRELGYNMVENQPAIGLIESRIEYVRNAIIENVRNNIVNVERTLKDIDKRISEVEKELNKLPGTERRLINIQREFELNNTVYTYMLEKRSEAAIAKASNVPGNRIIDRAVPSNCALVKPKARKNYLFAIMFGIFIPGLYIFLVDQLHNKIFDRKDIEKGTAVPIIGFIGHNTYRNEIPVIEKPGSSLAESFRTVRTNLKYYLNGAGRGVISVTSTISGEGKTFVAMNLAAVLAGAGRKTLLVSIDLRRPRLNRLLGMEDEEGLSTFLAGESSYKDIIKQTGIENLSFVTSGPVPPNPSELLDSERMKEFFETAKKDFEFIVLDTPPVGVVSDALLIGLYSDINIFVIRQRFSHKSTLELIQSIYEKQELKNPAIVVNDINVTGYYGYGLRYGYGFYYGYGYSYGYSQYGVYGKGDYRKYYLEE